MVIILAWVAVLAWVVYVQAIILDEEIAHAVVALAELLHASAMGWENGLHHFDFIQDIVSQIHHYGA